MTFDAVFSEELVRLEMSWTLWDVHLYSVDAINYTEYW